MRGAIGAAAGHDTHIFDQAAKAVLKGLVNLCTIRDPHTVEYLAPVVRAAQARPIWIATPNYDRGVELAAEAAGVELDLGLREDGIFGEFKEKAPICLAKLHGSVDWSMNRDWSVRVGGYGGDSTALIFGSGNKLRVEGPYLDLLLAFRRQLNRTNALEVCGYSFRDAHVNHLLLRWLTQDAARRIHVFDPCLTMDQIEDNVGRTLGRERKLKKSWLPSVLVLENIGVKEWAAKDG